MSKTPIPASPVPSIPSIPPIGAAPENHDFSHPWIISTIVSAICFGVGFVLMKVSGLWANFQQWADGPFLFYFAILAPVILGFTGYGLYLLARRVLGKRAKR